MTRPRSATPPPPVTGDSPAAFLTAWRTVTGWNLRAQAIRPMRAAHWQARHVHEIDRLARFAIDHRTGTYQQIRAWYQVPDGPHFHAPVAAALAEAAVMFAEQQWSAPTTLRWLAAAAASPLPNPTLTLAAMVAPDDPTVTVAPPALDDQASPTVSEVSRWEQAVPGELAPLAWLAGLTIEEAARMHCAGSLTPESVQTLLALRGLLPPGPPESG